MNRYLVLLIAALMLALWPAQAQAQCTNPELGTPTCATRTTLAADASATANVITVTSATGFTVGNFVWVDYELMEIRSVTGTSIGVTRGQRGTAAQAHDNTDAVFTGTGTGGPRGAGHFNVNDPDFGQDCTRGQGQATHLPWFNIRTGRMWTCDVLTSTTEWTATSKAPETVNSEPTQF